METLHKRGTSKYTQTIMSSQKLDELKYNLKIMLPAMNLYERVEILNAGRASAPLDVSQGVLELAERVLTPSDWTALKSKLGIK